MLAWDAAAVRAQAAWRRHALLKRGRAARAAARAAATHVQRLWRGHRGRAEADGLRAQKYSWWEELEDEEGYRYYFDNYTQQARQRVSERASERAGGAGGRGREPAGLQTLEPPA